MSEWISCAETMPEKNQKVIVNIDFGSGVIPPLVDCGKYTNGAFKIGPNYVHIADDSGIVVTHWHPLPNPPSEE